MIIWLFTHIINVIIAKCGGPGLALFNFLRMRNLRFRGSRSLAMICINGPQSKGCFQLPSPQKSFRRADPRAEPGRLNCLGWYWCDVSQTRDFLANGKHKEETDREALPASSWAPGIPFLSLYPLSSSSSAKHISNITPFSKVCQHLFQIIVINVFNRLQLAFWEIWQQTTEKKCHILKKKHCFIAEMWK